ncbi:hypothetical protein [Serratia sp. DD3]|nr:hypothetical protein [Serratia sp. DD3]KEY56972.1 hypothetical protein SRDD_42210 [Serratia sp. DD3]
MQFEELREACNTHGELTQADTSRIPKGDISSTIWNVQISIQPNTAIIA